MKIYRAERADHRGAHQFCDTPDFECHDNLASSAIWKNDREVRPTPQADQMPEPPECMFDRTCDVRFGFKSLVAAKKWFHERANRKRLAKAGVKIYTYAAEPYGIGKSGQVAFDLNTAKKLSEVRNFETFEKE